MLCDHVIEYANTETLAVCTYPHAIVLATLNSYSDVRVVSIYNTSLQVSIQLLQLSL